MFNAQSCEEAAGCSDIESEAAPGVEKRRFPGDYRQWVEEPEDGTEPGGLLVVENYVRNQGPADLEANIWNDENSLMFRSSSAAHDADMVPPPAAQQTRSLLSSQTTA